ncbi:MAG TPA: DUF1553 domain-containing protein [Opitutaceae bacterium]|nr:DUF1553 domain-containing protein [Opitutaceae bacterium]
MAPGFSAFGFLHRDIRGKRISARWPALAAIFLFCSGSVFAAALPFDGPPVSPAAHPIDQCVFQRLRELGIEPARLCSDEVFVRRVFLDTIGTLPTADEARAFLASKSPAKRSELIDRLLQRDEFADYWAMKWSDLLRVKAEYPINLWPNAAQEYHRWIRASLQENKPYDRFVRELLTSSGSNFRVGPVNFYRAVQSRDAQTIARTVALTFMGARMEKWPADQQAGLAAFFAQIGYKHTDEWKEEIVFFDPSMAPPPGPPAAKFPDGTTATLSPDRDPREIFADWLVDPKNPWFTRAIANRIWAWLLGRGIIDAPDDIRPDNPPSNPELIDYLQRELVAAHFDLKHLFRIILESQTYQLSCVPRSDKPGAAANFAFYPVRRLEAEVLIDALDQITGGTEQYTSAIPEPFTYIPENVRSIALPDGSITSSFLEMFGRPPRDTGLESERNNHPTAGQRLYLLNSSQIQRKLAQGPKLQALLRAGHGRPREIVDALYLAILSRYPTDDERAVIAAYAQSGGAPRQTAIDLAWALINSAEFLHRH